MSDAYIPDNDAVDQAREVGSAPADDDAGDGNSPALAYPQQFVREANEADVLEQAQEVPWDDDHE